jgi:hypothetical protein
MYTYDAITKDGLIIHLSMSTGVSNYILVIDTYNDSINMKYFTDVETAREFIQSFIRE